MKIKAHDWEYGAVLHQIVMHPVFTAINKVTDKAGLYLINDSTHLLIKNSNDPGPEWTFSFRPEDLQLFTKLGPYIALNCGSQTVCLLDDAQVNALVDVTATTTQAVKVRFNNNESMRVSGPLGKLAQTVPHNAFPAEIFGRVLPKQEAYAWPELGQLNFYQVPPEKIFSSTNRMLDLSDNLGWRFRDKMTVYMGVSTVSHKWSEWSEERLQQIEDQIKYDLSFDGFKVKVQRHTPAIDPSTKKKDRPCSDEFVWKLTITA